MLRAMEFLRAFEASGEATPARWGATDGPRTSIR